MSWLPIVVIVLAVAVASVRLCMPPRPPRVRLIALLVLQAAAAALLYFTLHPPPRALQADTLVIATGGASANAVAAIPAATHLRLPEAAVMREVPAVPDLATALRQHPGTRELVIVGDGLPARDRGTAMPAALRFIASPPPRGLVELHAPPLLVPGARFVVGSRVQGMSNVRVELLDPAGHRVDITTPDAAGRVHLAASTRDAGDTQFTLRVLDATGKVLDQLPVPVRVQAIVAPTLRLLAAAPGPELKYLQRWASDTGASLQTGIQVGGGVQLGDAPAALDAASLAKLDLLLLDERRLAALSSAQRGSIAGAMRGGLGVLVRMSGPLDANARRALREWGLNAGGGERTTMVKLPNVDSGDGNTSNESAALTIERFNLSTAGNDTVPLLHAADGSSIGGWRAVGQGRLGVLPVSDSYTLVLAGHAQRHAELWNDVLATLARPLPTAPLAALPAWGWANERNVLCGLPVRSQAIGADGKRSELLADPMAGNCSGWWPTQPGWHTLVAGQAQATMMLLDPAQARALHTQQMRDATFAIRGSDGPGNVIRVDAPGTRWPWLLAFILVSGLLWWLERRKPHSPAPAGAA
ncbi:carboxypeptidase regulatory-like domain-containing protein [Stenotrophomonas sp. SY1]|uniref:carboxypeptidase regulatory-like domain-containing protein n=1 Tax=Stenotrophomonas sp. SY1 TaxID=477235 RepID=UPI001E532B1C|nr:carboxypeptidase regulatory-like domain-containing protein [Stenotrophomonas sp. SY1]MCD9088527.1 carboxypeptidase regulatory-like domain-containing protein [Stenotrophomonas sp. SY1]